MKKKWLYLFMMALIAGILTIPASAQWGEYEYEQGEGVHEEEWYDPTDWFDTEEGVSYETDYWDDDDYLYDDWDYEYDAYGDGWYETGDQQWEDDEQWWQDDYTAYNEYELGQDDYWDEDNYWTDDWYETEDEFGDWYDSDWYEEDEWF